MKILKNRFRKPIYKIHETSEENIIFIEKASINLQAMQDFFNKIEVMFHEVEGSQKLGCAALINTITIAIYKATSELDVK
ncbi:MAG TPA: hypothetical protein VIH61_06630 [Waddliaceae bacterium]